MTDSINHSVRGYLDNIAPSYNPEGLWHQWSMSEIFLGPEGKGKYVPKILDHVVEPRTNVRHIVTALDQTTLIPTLEILGTSNTIGMNSTDLLYSAGPGMASQNYRIFYDKTVFPYRLSIQTFCQIRSVQAAYAKIIYGPLYGNHEVISRVYDAAGNFVTDRVPLDIIALEPGWTNYHIKTVRPCHTTKELSVPDQLTVVIYSEGDSVLGTTTLTVVESNFIVDQNSATDYITHISLKSPYLSKTKPNLLEIPLNWTKDTLNILGNVHYSSGKVTTLPIDNKRFFLDGFSQLLSSIPGHELDMKLRYKLSEGEVSISETSVFGNSIPLNLRVKLVESQNSYAVKLYCFPEWDFGIQEYRLRWWLMNLERNMCTDVTNYIRFAANSPMFDGLAFGVIQRLQVNLDLGRVFPTSSGFNHTQRVNVSLMGAPTDFQSPWNVKHVETDLSTFGGNVYARLVSSDTINISNGLTKEDWLNQIYGNNYPLTENPDDESTRIEPSHFTVRAGGIATAFPMELFDDDLKLVGVNLKRGENVSIVFTKLTASANLYLGIASLNIA